MLKQKILVFKDLKLLESSYLFRKVETKFFL